MTKINLQNLSSFNFKLIQKKVKKDNKKITKLVKGECVKDNNVYKIKIDSKILTNINSKYPDLLYLDFTEESYNLKGVVSVFSKTADEKGRYTRYIRNESQCKFFPGSKDKLVPFCPNWICSGYIVRRNGKMMFDFNECIAPKGYALFNPEL